MPDTKPSEWDELATTVHVWHWRTGGLTIDQLTDRAWPLMSAEERGRLDAFQADAPRLAFLAARSLCRTTLSRYTGVEPRDWVFSHGPEGKPAIAGPREFAALRFNLTHTDGLVAMAVTRVGEVGIDAEAAEGEVDVESVSRHFLSRDERDELLALPIAERERSFRKLWVVKEAYLKGEGPGLSAAPEAFTVWWGGDGQPMPLGAWQLSLHRPTPGHVAAVAVSPTGSGTVPVLWREFRG